MRWEGHRESSNIEDRRDGGDSGGFGGDDGGFGGDDGSRYGPSSGGLGGLPINIGGGGIGTIVIMLIIAWVLGINPLTLLSGTQIGPSQAPQSYQRSERPVQRTPTRNDQLTRFVAVVLGDNEDRWRDILPQQAGDLVSKAAGMRYEEPKLVLFSGSTRSPCGAASAATGPFYCPADRKVYIDLAFYDELKTRFRAPGDFAQAYVVAHEVGHHVQNLLGTSDEVQRLSRKHPDEANALSIRLELQADCLAGVWARNVYQDDSSTRGLERGDIEEGLGAAAAVGDDRIQERATGRIDPESWNHGSSEQRVKWFRVGFDSGAAERCDTFGVERP